MTGKAHRVSRQMEGRHRGARAKALAELVDLYLEWREHNDEPIGPAQQSAKRPMPTKHLSTLLGAQAVGGE